MCICLCPVLIRICILFCFLMIRRPPRSTLDRSSAASDVYKRQVHHRPAHAERGRLVRWRRPLELARPRHARSHAHRRHPRSRRRHLRSHLSGGCLLYTSDAADERSSVDLGGRRIIKKKKRMTSLFMSKLSQNTVTPHAIINLHRTTLIEQQS